MVRRYRPGEMIVSIVGGTVAQMVRLVVDQPESTLMANNQIHQTGHHAFEAVRGWRGTLQIVEPTQQPDDVAGRRKRKMKFHFGGTLVVTDIGQPE